MASDAGGGTSGASDAEAGSEAESAAEESGSSEGGGETGEAEQTGRQLYLAYCAACHGLEAEGTDLGYELRHHDEAHFKWVVRNGRPGIEFPGSIMAPFAEGTLDDADLDDILAYLGSFPTPTSAERLYLDYCGNCHGPDGTGGSVNKEIVGKSLHDVSEKSRIGTGLASPGNRATFMPKFARSRILDDELQLIVEFIGG